MKMYDVEVALNGGDVWIAQDCGLGDTTVVKLHPDQVLVVCEWLMRAIGAKAETREV
jgi:hypothetical protein